MPAKRIEGNLDYIGLPWVVQMVKNLPAMQETKVRFLGPEDPLEKGMATHSSTLAWRISWSKDLVDYSLCNGKESDRAV